jgi:endogenous inhibitor of DNA gyrase (YacG/DUF329 family)
MRNRTMPKCPYCEIDIDGKQIRKRLSLKSYQNCPSCGKPFTIDKESKRRQKVAIPLALISLVLTLGLFSDNEAWIIPAFFSYIILGLYIYRANKRVEFVPYEDGKKK